jgi:lipoate-protein ligase A
VNDPYRVVRALTTAGEFHQRSVPDPAPNELWWPEITAPALVLGSSQPEQDIDREACERAGVAVVRRRSGGGAVLLLPGEVTWLDVIVPLGSAGWSDDVHGPMVWLGRHLAAVVEELLDELLDDPRDTGADRPADGGLPAGGGRAADAGLDVSVHAGPMVTTRWSSTVCFDGVGAGEVLLGGRKLIGISQRRTRHAARLQCCWYSHYDPARLVELLAPAARPTVTDLRPVATVAPVIADAMPPALAARLA